MAKVKVQRRRATAKQRAASQRNIKRATAVSAAKRRKPRPHAQKPRGASVELRGSARGTLTLNVGNRQLSRQKIVKGRAIIFQEHGRPRVRFGY